MAPPGEVLRFITCGSVDDGKSTLLGRLLFETGQIPEDQLRSLAADSRRFGTQGDQLDLALLVDGLAAEQEQGITIDVAYRYFGTPRRRFIVADTPGHEQYTRNMVTGASTAEMAVLLVDARKGLLPQTLRHARIAALTGIRHVVLAVNKMDAVEYSETVFQSVVDAFGPTARELGLEPYALPLSALAGDNVVVASPRMPWFRGLPLLPHLETVPVSRGDAGEAASFPVQWVNRPGPDFRGLAGRVSRGRVRAGMAVRVLPGDTPAVIRRIVGFEEELEAAEAGDSALLELDGHLDVSRGAVLVEEGHSAQVVDELEADLVWLTEAPLVPGRPYWVRIHHAEVSGTVSVLHHRVDVQTGKSLPAASLEMNEIARVTLRLERPVPAAPYGQDRRLGAVVLVDKPTHATVGAAMVRGIRDSGRHLYWQALEVDRAARSRLMGHPARCIWFTGLSGAGKSTLANLLEKSLHSVGVHTYLLDGDNVRQGLNRDLGFSVVDRAENIRRVSEVARLMVDAGLVVVVAFISPFRAERAYARSLFAPEEFVEVFVDTPLSECEARDPKGLYRRARQGLLKDFTGVDSQYEPPERPEVRVETHGKSPEDAANEVYAAVMARVERGGRSG